MDIRIRRGEGCARQPFLLWDTVWNAARGAADWALQGFAAATNKGGLAADAAIETAVVIQLMTDRRCPPDHPLARLAEGDPRGWWGDGVDVRADRHETELGSLWWLLERATVDEGLLWAGPMAQDALAPLVAQGAAVRIDAVASERADGNGISVAIALYGRGGGKIYDRQFEIVWAQIGLR